MFETCNIGGVSLPNRIVMPPMTTSYAKGGFVTDCMVDYYAERGRGGVGLIIVEDASVESATGRRATHHDLFGDDDKYLPGLRHLAQGIKTGGARAALNLSHGGKQSAKALIKDGLKALAPSAIPNPPDVMPGEMAALVPALLPREMTIEDIQGLEDRFAEAAVRAREAGFDLVSLHGSHSYLINQFLSPAHNRREDVYGRDAEGRIRFLLEIVRKIRIKAGDDYPILVRMPGEEQAKGGLTIADCQEIARRLEKGGADCLSISVDLGIMSARIPPPVAPPRFPRGCMAYLAAAIKQVVSIPVMTANRIVTPQLAEEILEQGKADLIGIGRGLIADPEWPAKAREGREDDIRHCIGCMHCTGTLDGTRCSVNVAAGREAECRIAPAPIPKTIFIAGGGPAGMEAARVSALRGHKVQLFEKGKLGGQLNLACVPPAKAEIISFLTFEERQLSRLGVQIKNRQLTAQEVVRERPDAVIIATGARPAVPALPGIDRKLVVNAWQVLSGEVAAGDRVVVLGGGQAGAETAEYLAATGKKVVLVGRRDEIAADEHRLIRIYLLNSLAGLGVRTLPKTAVREILDNGVVVDRGGEKEFIEADTVVLALHSEPDHQLADELKAAGVQFSAVGDCAGARKVFNAVEEGFMAALKL